MKRQALSPSSRSLGRAEHDLPTSAPDVVETDHGDWRPAWSEDSLPRDLFLPDKERKS